MNIWRSPGKTFAVSILFVCEVLTLQIFPTVCLTKNKATMLPVYMHGQSCVQPSVTLTTTQRIVYSSLELKSIDLCLPTGGLDCCVLNCYLPTKTVSVIKDLALYRGVGEKSTRYGSSTRRGVAGGRNKYYPIRALFSSNRSCVPHLHDAAWPTEAHACAGLQRPA